MELVISMKAVISCSSRVLFTYETPTTTVTDCNVPLHVYVKVQHYTYTKYRQRPSPTLMVPCMFMLNSNTTHIRNTDNHRHRL